MSSGSGFPWSKQWPEITDERVRRAFSKVARSAFVPAEWRDYADRDEPLPIGEGQTISQPYVVALMTQAIRLQPGERVLEIGTGSGFQTALLCELAWQEGAALGETVYSLERFPSLLLSASTTLTRLGYAPHLRQGDGAAGWPDAAPFECDHRQRSRGARSTGALATARRRGDGCAFRSVASSTSSGCGCCASNTVRCSA
jgi:protein-L-isoaspartate(D-aspartate) O-methyltransferase